ncbi:MAG: hypothetical protein IJ859_01660 [Synergistaceae bacterium]|nr:hypothetical protein [Synergistaceae bacterium]
MKVGDALSSGKIVTSELLEILRTKKEKQDMYDWLVKENEIALKVLYGVIPDPDDGLTSKNIRLRKRRRAKFIEFIELIFGDEFPSVKEKFPYVFSLKTSRILCGLHDYSVPEKPIGTPWLEIMEL